MELLFLAILLLIMAWALGSGYPVAFALPGAAIISIGLAAGAGYLFGGGTDAYFHSGGPSQWLSAGVTNLRGVYWEVDRDTLIAIPLFIFMGIMLQRSKIAEDLLVTMAKLFGPVPGGLGISVVFVGALLAATTGIVGATVVAMGLISLPAMLRNNYSPSLASGTIAASGTLGQIIPPSIVLIILADQLASATDQASTMRKLLHKEATGELTMPSVFDVSSTSAGEMFLGALVPGILLVMIYMLYILAYAIINPKSAPSVPRDEELSLAFWGNVALTLIPPLTLIFLVLGSIIAGVATVNQAGAIGAAGAMIMAGYRLNREGRNTYVPAITGLLGLAVIAFALANYPMNLKAASTAEDMTGIYIGAFGTFLMAVSLIWSGIRVMRIEDTLTGVMLETAKTTSLVFVILLGAAMLTAAFRAFGGEELVRDFLTGLPGGFWIQFLIVMLVIFLLGFFLDFIEIAVVVVPIVAPILLADPTANITAVWLGVMIGLNIQTSFLTPPFGFALFYLRGVAPAAVKTIQIYKGVFAFITLQLIALLIVGFYPPLVNYLPNRSSYLSETSPPPRNPRLQYCMDDYVLAGLQSDGARTDRALATLSTLDLSALPGDLARGLRSAAEDAMTFPQAMSLIPERASTVQAAAREYRPLLEFVRSIEKRIRNHELDVAGINTEMGRVREAASESRVIVLEAEKEELEAAIATLEAQIPETWDQVHDTFKALTDDEENARLMARRIGDSSYEAVAKVAAVLRGNEAFSALAESLRALRTEVENGDPVATMAALDALANQFRDIEGAGDIRSDLGAARRAIERTPDNRAEAVVEFDSAQAEYDAQAAWRDAAGVAVLPGLEAFLDDTKATLGVRYGQRLTRDQGMFLAGCTANHRSLTLSF
ncbi:MAG: TRAP transporter large permease subunit [Proteobacteria bacterium]|nr:TRAP transporter large permease subunit [Pseudomonadota bacterium]